MIATSQTEPLVSVIIPAYGHADCIDATLHSALNQTLTSREIIVVNDGSPDNTHEILQPYVAAGLIRYVRQQNQGQSRARNAGLQLACGKYISFLDDDDVWPPDKLEHQVKLLETNPSTVFVYGPVELFRGNPAERQPHLAHRKYPSGNAYRKFLLKNFIVSPGQVLIRAESLHEIGGFDTNLWGVDDYDLWLRLAKKGQVQFSTTTALYYRLHDKNASRNSKRMYDNFRALRRKHFGLCPPLALFPAWVASEFVLRQSYFNVYLNNCREHLAKHAFSTARYCLATAVAIYPVALLHRSFWKEAYLCLKWQTKLR